MIKQTLLLLLIITVCYSQNYKVFTLSDGYHAKFDGIGRDRYGNVYVAAGKYGNAALFKYNADTDSLKLVGTVQAASIAASNWLADDVPGKIHTKIEEHPDGRLFFASHSESEGLDYSGFRGGHVYSYNPITGEMKDESIQSVGIPHQGIMDIAIAIPQNLVYLVGYPDGDIYGHDITTGLSHFIMSSGSYGGGVSRYMFADNSGRLYYPRNSYFMTYNPVDSTKKARGIGLSETNQISCLVKSWSGDTVYLVNHGTYHLFRYIPEINQIDNLGPLSMDSTNHEVCAIALRWDINTLFYAPDYQRKLIAWNLTTNQKTVFSSIPTSSFTGSNGIDKNGDIIFSVKGSFSSVYKFNINIPCPMCSTTSAEVVPTAHLSETLINASPNPFASVIRFGFFAEAKTNAVARLTIWFPNGQLIATLLDGSVEPAQYHRVVWNSAARNLPCGVYLAQLNYNNKIVTKKILLSR